MPHFYRDLDEHGQPIKREACPDCGLPCEFGDLCPCQAKSPAEPFVLQGPMWSETPHPVAEILAETRRSTARNHAASAAEVGLPPETPWHVIYEARQRLLNELLGIPSDSGLGAQIEAEIRLGITGPLTIEKVRAAVAAKEAAARPMRGGRPVARAG